MIFSPWIERTWIYSWVVHTRAGVMDPRVRLQNFKTIITLSHKITFITFSVPLFPWYVRFQWDVEWRIKIENENVFSWLLYAEAGKEVGEVVEWRHVKVSASKPKRFASEFEIVNVIWRWSSIDNLSCHWDKCNSNRCIIVYSRYYDNEECTHHNKSTPSAHVEHLTWYFNKHRH